MKVCKWAGDVNDEYCKGCNGITMEVDGNSISCSECAGYEEGDTEAGSSESEDIMPKPTDKEEVPFEEESTKTVEKNAKKQTKEEKTTNNTAAKEKPKNDPKNKATNNKSKVTKVAEEKKSEEKTEISEDDVKIVSIRYTSGATIKKGDNYFKFIAEEEWDVSNAKNDIQDVRDQLWAKLNAEVDSQIEELQNMN